MNSTESLYAEQLIARKLSGEIVDYGFERIKFKLAPLTYYTPDFDVQMADGTIELHEVKAATSKGVVLAEEDAKVKIKVAAALFPQFDFIMAAKLPKKAGGGWIVKNYSE
jgi:hypothetical protein